MHTTRIKNARWIVTCDAQDTIIPNADIYITDGIITHMGTDVPSNADTTIDATGMTIYPGLVNTHHHFFQTFVRNLVSVDYTNMTVPQWLDAIYRIFSLVDDEVVYYASLTAFADLLKHGCTTAFDHQYCFTKSMRSNPIDRQFEAAKALGIRYIAGRGTNTLPNTEGSTIPDQMMETTDAFLLDCERLAAKFHDTNPLSMTGIVVAPCQPINSYQETFVQSMQLARRLGLRLHTHLGEGENEIIVARHGMRTLPWCEEIGFIGPDVWYAHCWEETLEEFSTMARTKTGVSHCPAPAVLGGHQILPIRDMLAMGVPLGLGVDGAATNDGSNLLDSLRMAFLMQCYTSKERNGACSAYDILKVATSGGAQVLGRSNIGSLQVGYGADLFAVKTDALELVGTIHDPKNLLGRVGVTGNVELTMVNGNVVQERGHLCGIDEEEIARKAERTCTKTIRNNSGAFPLP